MAKYTKHHHPRQAPTQRKPHIRSHRTGEWMHGMRRGEQLCILHVEWFQQIARVFCWMLVQTYMLVIRMAILPCTWQPAMADATALSFFWITASSLNYRIGYSFTAWFVNFGARNLESWTWPDYVWLESSIRLLIPVSLIIWHISWLSCSCLRYPLRCKCIRSRTSRANSSRTSGGNPWWR